MEYRIKDYTIKGQRILLPRQTSIEDLRLIFNETQKKLICSTATKDNVTLVQGEDGTLVEVPTSVCSLNSTDLLTIKCDYGDNLEKVKEAVENIDLTSIERNVDEVKQAVENIDLTPIENKVDEGVSTLADKIDNIQLPEIDTTELAKQGENQEATMSAVLDGINSIANSMVTSLQEKVVAPQKYVQEVTPDNDKVALKKVIVMGYTPEVVKIDNSEFEIPENIKVDINKITTGNVIAEYACAVGLLFPLSTKNINLNFADAYYTCDGAFYDFITEYAFPEDIYPSKWIVAYFKTETAVMNISGWSPQEICVRGHLGGIQSSEAGITEKILIPDGSSVGFIDMTNTQLLTQSIKNVRTDKSATMVYRNTSAYGVFDIAVEELTQGVLIKDYVLNARVLSFSKLKKIDGGKVIENYNVSSTPLVEVLDFPELEECLSCSKTNNSDDLTQAMVLVNYPLVNLCKINVPKLRVIKAPLYYGNYKKQEKIESIDLPSVEVITCEVISSDILNLLTNLKRITFSKLKECASELYYIDVTIPLRMEYPELERIALPYNEKLGVQKYIAIRTPENVYAPKLKICDLTYSWQYTGVFSDTTTRDVFDLFPTIEEVITGPYEGAIFNNIKSSSIIMPSLKRASVCSRGNYSRCAFFSAENKIGTISSISLPSIESYKLKTSYNANYKVNVDRFYLGCKGNPTDLVYLDAGVADTYTTDIEIGEGARQKISIINYNGLTAENIALHILDKLADNTDGETIPIIIGSTNLARINASEYAQYVAAAQAKNYTIA